MVGDREHSCMGTGKGSIYFTPDIDESMESESVSNYVRRVAIKSNTCHKIIIY